MYTHTCTITKSTMELNKKHFKIGHFKDYCITCTKASFV